MDDVFYSSSTPSSKSTPKHKPKGKPKPTTSFEVDREAQKLCTDIFANLDKDNSGEVDQTELVHALQALHGSHHGLGLDDSFCATLIDFSEIDHDHSGAITKDEWSAFCFAIYEVIGQKRFLEMNKAWLSSLQSGETLFGSESRQQLAAHRRIRGKCDKKKYATAPENGHENEAQNEDQLIDLMHEHDEIIHKLRNSDIAKPNSGMHEHDDVIHKFEHGEHSSRPNSGHKKSSSRSESKEHSGHGESGSKPTSRPGSGHSEPKPKSRPNSGHSDHSAKHNSRPDSGHGEQRTKSNETNAPIEEEQLTTLEDVWELLANFQTHIDVNHFVELLDKGFQSGLDKHFAKSIPQRVDQREEPVGFTGVQIVCMIRKIKEHPYVSCEELLKEATDDAQGFEGKSVATVTRQTGCDSIELPSFRLVMRHLSTLTQIEEWYLLHQLHWFELAPDKRRFEVHPAMWELIINGCQKANSHLEHSLKVNDFEMLCRQGNLIDPHEKQGLHFSTLMSVFLKHVRDMPKLISQRQLNLQAVLGHAELHSAKTIEKQCLKDQINGRAQFSILMERLHAEQVMAARFATPLQLVTELIKEGTYFK